MIEFWFKWFKDSVFRTGNFCAGYPWSWYPLWTILIFCLVLSLEYSCWVPTNENSLFGYVINFPTSYWLFGFCKGHSDWLNFRHFPGYQIMIYFICRLTKREDRTLILISTIQELLAQAEDFGRSFAQPHQLNFLV